MLNGDVLVVIFSFSLVLGYKVNNFLVNAFYVALINGNSDENTHYRFTHGKRICTRVARANTPVFFKSNAVILNDGKGNGLILYEACSKFVCNVCFIVIGGFWPLLSIFTCYNSCFKELNIFNSGCVMAAYVSNFNSFIYVCFTANNKVGICSYEEE